MAEQGTRIADRYELVAQLGEGGMGVVWRARDTRLGRAVAVKLLSASSMGSDSARMRLIREARAAATLEHEGVIRVYDVGELDNGGAFLVMELVRGRSLRDELGRGLLTPGRAARLVAAAARALDFAHKAGVVHRDVKPDNIMIRTDGRVIVVDFGVAKPVSTDLVVNAETLAGVTGATLTGAGQIVGTPAYLSPEQARGPDVGAETDQFALAVTAFEAMTGRRPWTGRGAVEIVASILKDKPVSLRSIVPTAPPALEVAIERALAKEAEDRFPDMAAFAAALEEAVADLPADPESHVVTSTGAGSKSGSVAKSRSAVSTNGGQTATPPQQERTRRGALVGVLAAAVLGGGGFLALRARMAATDDAAAHADAAFAADTIACPQFEVTGVDAPELGGAAAALACDRIQLAHGGADAKTLAPAEIASAPRGISPGFPLAIFDAPGGREKAIAVAKQGARWLDGKVDKHPEGYVVTAVLRGRAETEIARGEGRGVELFEAVRDAMAPVLRAVPPTKEEAALLKEWLDVDSVDDVLALQDIRTAVLIEDPFSVRAACATAAQRKSLPARVSYLAESACRRKLRTGPMQTPPPALDESTPGALITTALAQGTAGGPAAVRERAQRLEKARDATTIAEGKARLSAAAAELYNLIGDEGARGAARNAVIATPKGIDWRTSAWHRVAYTSAGDVSLAGAVSAWQPWEPVAQALWGAKSRLDGDASSRSSSIQRAYFLSQRGPYETMYGVDLIERGDVESARNVAEFAHDDMLRIEILLAEARYGAVLAKVPGLIAALPANDENAATAFRFAQQAVRASLVLERPADFVGPVVERYVLSEPHHVIDGVMPVVSLINACTLAPRSIGKPCIERLEQLRRDGKLATIFATLEPVLAGAQRFVADDYAGAAKAWRTLLRSAGWVQGPLRDPVAIAFDKAGEFDLAEEVDAPTVALVDLPRTADLSWARAARRAYKRGDHAQARRLAQAVIEKWRFADEKIPATQEMKDLLAKLPP